MTDNSCVTFHQGGGMSFTGDGVDLFRAATIKSGLGLYRKTGMKPNRAWTPTAMLAAAGQITGKRYKRGQFQQAEDDLQIWIDACKAAMPIVDERRH